MLKNIQCCTILHSGLLGAWSRGNAVKAAGSALPKPSHIIGDIAVLKPGADTASAHKLLSQRVRVVLAQEAPLSGPFRLGGLQVVAGEPRLETTHTEWGLSFHLTLGSCFFNPRLQAERRRVCELVGAGERILVLFAGVGIWPIILAARSPCREVVGVELNAAAHSAALKNVEANGLAAKVRCIMADAAELRSLGLGQFDRVVAPRPKDHATEDALAALPAAVKPGGHLHVYGFATSAEQEDLTALKDGSDLEGLAALAGVSGAFELERLLRCPRNSIGRRGGQSVYRVVMDMRRLMGHDLLVEEKK